MAEITLTIIKGNLLGKHYTFKDRTTCVIGRAKDCGLKLPNNKHHRNISRYHCHLNINPPHISIRDMGSKHGTYVNGSNIQQPESAQTTEETNLVTGDEIDLGDTAFRVTIKDHNAIFTTGEFATYQQPTPQLTETSQTARTITISPQIIASPPTPTAPSWFFQKIQNLLQRAMGGDKKLKSIKHYTIEKKLGEGGFAAVYLATHQRTKRQVALKVMRPAIAAKQWAIDRFQREIETTKALKHPHIVQLQEHGYADGTFFFTMEYCDGGTIGDLVHRRGGKLPVDEALSFIFLLLDALTYAHNATIPHVQQQDGTIGEGKGLVHRDIKPQNIYLKIEGTTSKVKLGDYGLSKAFDLAGLSGLSMSGVPGGTYQFMPRQQFLDFKYAKPEVDVWAAAATLYYLLTGNSPRNFLGIDPLQEALNNEPVPIRQRDASIPQQLAQVIDLALVEQPEIHFKTAAEFKQQLENAVKYSS